MAELIAGMFNASRYKRSQGRIARQLTFAAIALAVGVGAWLISGRSPADDVLRTYVLPLTVLSVGLWIGFRLTNFPRFADFLISVEAEMNKVSWPSRPELWRASMVVIVVIFFLAGLLFAYDAIIDWILDKAFGL